MLARLSLVLLLSLAPSLGQAELLQGSAVVVDGDTLRVDGISVRLHGIAAPELREAGGKEAKTYLTGLVNSRTVVCDLTRERTRGRRVGICRINGKDLAEQVVAAGLARDCPRYSNGRYATAEQPAAQSLPFLGYCRPRRR